MGHVLRLRLFQREESLLQRNGNQSPFQSAKFDAFHGRMFTNSVDNV
jgi:hypothetical protein